MPEGVAAVKLARPAALLVIGLLTLAACQPSASQSPTGSEPPESGAPSGDDLEGDLQVIGSSTVEPIASLAMTAFGNLHPNVTYTVDGPGTGPGMEQFCADETDVGLASRTMSEEEAALCEDAGVEWVELKIGIDGLSVITSALNTELTCLSFLDLYALLGPESEGLETWDAANDLAAELDDALAGERGESHAPYPAEDLIVTAPGDESGTYASFVDLAIRGIADDRGQERTTRLDYTPSDEDPVIIEGVAGTADAPFTLGWVGYAFADQNRDQVTLLEVDSGDGCVAPTPETIESAEYPLSRFLYLYVNTGHEADNAALTAFIDYFLSDEGIGYVTEADYIALPEAEIEATRAAWDGR
jgi:phosphate transport system substrate-binding protein